MRTVYMISPDQFCQEQKETGGELPGAPLEIWCMATSCRYPGKRCLYVEKGGKRPQDGE
jgi:hypothetical protein